MTLTKGKMKPSERIQKLFNDYQRYSNDTISGCCGPCDRMNQAIVKYLDEQSTNQEEVEGDGSHDQQNR